jgi:hypothetical protein
VGDELDRAALLDPVEDGLYASSYAWAKTGSKLSTGWWL